MSFLPALLAVLALAAGSLHAGSSYAPLAPTPVPLPGVYRNYAPPRTPQPTPQADLSVSHIEVHQDSLSIDFKGGAALPMGDLAKSNGAGFSAGMDLIYGASSVVDGAFSLSYASMPYLPLQASSSADLPSTPSSPQTSIGLGLKAIVKLMQDTKLAVSVDGGLGYYFENVATAKQINGAVDSNNLPILTTVYESSGGIGFTLGLQAAYKFTPSFNAFLSADVTQVSLNGGTGDTPLYLSPSLGITYTF
jgi:hypothetical protein